MECLPILYANEFRFSKQRELCITFPNQVPAAGLASVRRITLWWTLGNDLQPHMSLQNKANYDLLWSAAVQIHCVASYPYIYRLGVPGTDQRYAEERFR